MGRLPVLAACLLMVSCGGQAKRREAGGQFVKQSAGYTGHYSADGRLERLVKDQDNNGKPEVVILYRPNGRMQSAEMDQDGDGTFDRWEQFTTEGVLAQIGTARKTPGRADTWEYLDAAGTTVVRREVDEDGDGKPDAPSTAGAMAADTLDTDNDGRPDRRLIRGSGGEVVAIEVDPDADGRWERLPVKGPGAAASR